MEIIKDLIKIYEFKKIIGDDEYRNGNLVINFYEKNGYVTLRFEDRSVQHINHKIFEFLGKFNEYNIEEFKFEINKKMLLKN